ncbi:MAG: sugar phosphate isomerase/epimerase [Oscillospiraceae bacterium]|nr:sugar phosphate isomerase/epimerase [Oscillospiraceae bacterium]
MKLSISNIAWTPEDDEYVYSLMQKYDFCGLEIAPTRIISECPYDNIPSAVEWYEGLNRAYGFVIPSMQSIWFGRQEKIFGSSEERKALIDYTKKAIDFASALNCKNLVFGCPRNRSVPDGADSSGAVDFFRIIGEYALSKGTVIGMEANPPIYNTNFINDTPSALELIEKVDCKGFLLNLDIGTMLHNNEPISLLEGRVKSINHVHISEPGLKPIERRDMHRELLELLASESYDRFVSVEMGKDGRGVIEPTLEYIKSVFR